MFKQFLSHIERNNLFSRADKVLLAVSGGLDSMVMLHLFRAAGFNIGVAHCNFQLRGDESDGDAALVTNTCINQALTLHLQRFETENYAHEHGLSIQVAARELRYNFFNELVDRHGYNYIATAHHLNDSIETVLLNLTRGTGIEGITGIPLKSERIIRPLLFATRAEIKEYATLNGLQWCEDSSNALDKYARNLLRNQVIPLLKTINPGFEDNFKDTLERLNGTSSLQKGALQLFANDAIRENSGELRINLQALKAQAQPGVVLWESIKNKGFSYSKIKDVLAIEHQPGSVFYSASFQLTVDRDDLIITERRAPIEDNVTVITENTTSATWADKTLELSIVSQDHYSLDKDPQVAQLDLASVEFPLTWRKWHNGDHFIPLGMHQKKKISDFLVDSKVPLPSKENITVLESAGKIIWVVGYRIGDPVKITGKTKQILRLRLVGL